jgi:hypothetical protein
MARRRKRCKARLRRNPRRRTRTDSHPFTSALRRIRKTASGRRAEKIAKSFSAIKRIPSIKKVHVPGVPANAPFAGLGITERIEISRGPKGKAHTFKVHGTLVGDPQRRRLIIVRDRPRKGRRRKLGYCKTTWYSVPPDMAKEGSDKADVDAYYHHHEESGGKRPEVFEDSSGNIVYGKGTYTYRGKWLRK